VATLGFFFFLIFKPFFFYKESAPHMFGFSQNKQVYSIKKKKNISQMWAPP